MRVKAGGRRAREREFRRLSEFGGSVRQGQRETSEGEGVWGSRRQGPRETNDGEGGKQARERVGDERGRAESSGHGGGERCSDRNQGEKKSGEEDEIGVF